MHLFADKNKCYFCPTKEPTHIPKNKGFRSLIETHHLVERNEGGSNEPNNLVPCCSNCHSKIHLGIIKIDKWLDYAYCHKLHWWDENKKEYYGSF